MLVERGCVDPLSCADGNFVDANTTTAGTQYQCSVDDVQNFGQPGEAEQPIAECEGITMRPCWRIIDDSGCASGLAMEVERSDPPPANNVVLAFCAATCRYCSSP